MLLDGTQVSLDKSLEILSNFSCISGLAINYEKTNVYKIGQLKHMQGIYDTKQLVKWSMGPIDTLGVKIPIINRNAIYEINYQPKIRELVLKFKRWGCRKLSLKGKVTIVKTYGISKLLYLASVLPMPPDDIISSINTKIFNFIWNDKNDKIKRDVMINTFENGGLKLPHFKTFCKSLKITWVKRYIAENFKENQWIQLSHWCLQNVGGKFIFSCNLESDDINRLNLKSTFWTDILKSWCEYNFEKKNEIQNVNAQSIWFNSHIRVANKVLYNESCINNQLMVLDNLYYDCILLDRTLINIIYDTNLNIMEYNSIISAIPRAWKRSMAQNINPQLSHTKSIKYEQLNTMGIKCISKHVYTELIKNVTKSVNLQEKWSQYMIDNLNITNKCFTHIYKVTIDNTLRSFQFKLLHRILYFNDKLYVFGLTNSDQCDVCNKMSDSIEHRMWFCDDTQLIWIGIMQWYNEHLHTNVSVSYSDVISNISNNSLLDFIILSTKYYIYKCFIKKRPHFVQTLVDDILYLEKI